MTASEAVIRDPMLVQCPACGAQDAAEAADSSGEPAIVCRDCGETWPLPPKPAKRRGRRVKLRRRRGSQLIEAERRPLVTYTDNADSAWAAKIAGDYWPEPHRPSRLPMTAAAIAAMIFLAAFFAGREAAVAALPDLAGLYAAVGLPVNLEELAIEDVVAERRPTFAGVKLTVRATIRNLGRTPRSVPPLAAVLYDDALAPAGAYGFDPPAGTLGAGAALPILLALEGAPEKATEVALRFRRRGETLPAAGAAEAVE